MWFFLWSNWGVCQQKLPAQHLCSACGKCWPLSPPALWDTMPIFWKQATSFKGSTRLPQRASSLVTAVTPFYPGWWPLLLLSPTTRQRYNCVYATTRGTIEHLNGVIKCRFACLNYLRVEPQKGCYIICACCVTLHSTNKENATTGGSLWWSSSLCRRVRVTYCLHHHCSLMVLLEEL